MFTNKDAFRRPSERQFPLVATAVLSLKDLFKGGPVVTSANAKPGITEAGDVNTDGIKANNGSSLSTVAFNLFELPAGAIPIGGDLKVIQAFNSTTSDALIIGVSGTTNLFLTSTSLQSAARTALAVPNWFASTTTKVIATWTSGGGTPTEGQAIVTLQYIIAGRSVENQGV